MKTKNTFPKLVMRHEHLHLSRKQIAIFSVNGNYGSYQIKIGPADGRKHNRPIEINGRIHHLFVHGNHVMPLPTSDEVNSNLQKTVVMNDVRIRLVDKDGNGMAVRIKNPLVDGVHARKNINLAGKDGDKMMSHLEASGQLANETYQIVQEDILKSLPK